MSAEPQPASTIQPQPPPAPPAVRRGTVVCAAGLSASAARDGVQRHPASHDPDRLVDRLPDSPALFGDRAGPLRDHSRQRRDPRAGTAAGGGHSVNGHPVDISVLCHGDSLEIGPFSFRVETNLTFELSRTAPVAETRMDLVQSVGPDTAAEDAPTGDTAPETAARRGARTRGRKPRNRSPSSSSSR